MAASTQASRRSRHRPRSSRVKGQEVNDCVIKEYCAFPFLDDSITVGHIRRSKVMFIMRGLSGSGKTIIANLIKEKYSQTHRCSADDLFYSHGVYRYDSSRLDDAHNSCKVAAQSACTSGAAVVIIDNTNVESWEMEFYLKLAASHNYVVVIVVPKTPWRFEPDELVGYSEHRVPLSYLRRKLDKFETLCPMYYGWFLNEESSRMLLDVAMEYFKLCSRFLAPILCGYARRGLTLDKVYKSINKRNPAMLHCTAFYCNKSRTRENESYANSEVVQTSMGQAFQINVIGIFMTPRTVGAHVRLSRKQLNLWQNSDLDLVGDMTRGFDELSLNSGTSRHRTRGGSRGRGRGRGSGTPLNDHRGNGSGRTAHVTIGVASDVRPAQCGRDLEDILERERDSRGSEETEIKGNKVCCYGDAGCMIYLQGPLTVSTLFSGHYLQVDN